MPSLPGAPHLQHRGRPERASTPTVQLRGQDDGEWRGELDGAVAVASTTTKPANRYRDHCRRLIWDSGEKITGFGGEITALAFSASFSAPLSLRAWLSKF
ncbi:hypothetical protein E2562_036712 [Oryza meyeriana var. granulata]|uniref:Uncharacterized protein n=1 Tax=Oryza meyeriana var. granulata TaxID=110450 RepID=A0A6G1CMP8_9ORYZ|nr:hypothetical protein E2562_036712 [Oryza meyeriana var. granulata]